MIASSVLYAQLDEFADAPKNSDLVPSQTRSTDYAFVGYDDNSSTAKGSTTTCSPASSYWCATGFQEACIKLKGGLGSTEDGGVSCSVNNYEGYDSPDGFKDHERTLEETITLSCKGDCHWLVDICTEKEGVGTSVDGAVSCEVDNSNCSGCD